MTAAMLSDTVATGIAHFCNLVLVLNFYTTVQMTCPEFDFLLVLAACFVMLLLSKYKVIFLF